MKPSNYQKQQEITNKNKNNNKKPKSIWDINENDGDDPMGATYKKNAILNEYIQNKSAIKEQTAESMAKQNAGIISPGTQRMKSVFDESSSDDDDDGFNNNNNNYNNGYNKNNNNNKENERLVINMRHAKHNNVSSHFSQRL